MDELQIIQSKIYEIRGERVMLDRDIAALYNVETKVLNQAVKRNIKRFPEDFMFQLSKTEFQIWKSQIVTSNSDKMGLRRPPYAFTEQGVAMLSGILNSDVAIDTNIKIIRALYSQKTKRILNFLVSLSQRSLAHGDYIATGTGHFLTCHRLS